MLLGGGEQAEGVHLCSVSWGVGGGASKCSAVTPRMVVQQQLPERHGSAASRWQRSLEQLQWTVTFGTAVQRPCMQTAVLRSLQLLLAALAQ